MDCIFCKIITGDIPSAKVYEDDLILVIKDIHPAAPTHLLIMPKEHIENLFFVTLANKNLLGQILLTANKLAKQLKIGDKGFKLSISNGRNAGQEIDHMHFHFLSSKVFA